MFWQGILLIILLACSATVSSSETALFGLSRLQLKQFRESRNPLRVTAARLMLYPRQVLLTILIANTFVNILIFSIAAIAFSDLAQTHPLAASLGSIGVLFAVIIFGEVGPKALALSHPAMLAPYAAPIIRTLQILFSPLRLVLDRLIIEPIVRLISIPHSTTQHVSKEELRSLVESSARRGTINSVENEMLQEVVGLSDVKVRSIMIPRVDIVAVPADMDRATMLKTIREANFTKLPLYEKDLDDIKGLVYARDLYLRPDAPLDQITRPVQFVPEQANLIQLLAHFRHGRSQLAIVVDEYGGTAGLVTLEDVLEQIVGDIKGAGESEQPPVVEMVDANTYRLSGALSVREWAQQFGIEPGDLKVDTLGGLMLTQLGRMPHKGDTITIRNLTLTVESIIGRRIGAILLNRRPRRATAQAPASGPKAPKGDRS